MHAGQRHQICDPSVAGKGKIFELDKIVSYDAKKDKHLRSYSNKDEQWIPVREMRAEY
jgi:hypothetical protein